MTVLIVVLVWLSCFVLVGAVLYVLGTYLVCAYDRRLHAETTVRSSLTRFRRWRGVLYEMLATWICALVYPFGELPARIKPPRQRSIPILLVHGLNHNRSGWLSLRHKLVRAGFGAVYSLNLKRGNHSIAHHAKQLAMVAAEIERKTGIAELILIGHSMGGLVASMYTEHLAPLRTVTHVITIGSPLHGTRAAVLGGGQSSIEMRVGNAFTEELSRAIESNHTTQYFHIGSWLDNIVIPPQSALMGKRPGHERMLEDSGHLTLLFSNQVARQILDWLHSTVPVHAASSMRHAPTAGYQAPATGQNSRHRDNLCP